MAGRYYGSFPAAKRPQKKETVSEDSEQRKNKSPVLAYKHDWASHDESRYIQVDPDNPENLPERSYSPIQLTEDSSDEYSDMNLTNRTAPEHEPYRRKGHLVKFFRNGDPNFKGLTCAVNPKEFPSFETLLVWLNAKIPTPCGVKYVFRINDGKEVNDVSQFQGGVSYVVSSVRKPCVVGYGDSREKFWHNRVLSANRIRKNEKQLFTFPDKPHSHPGSRAGSQRYRLTPHGAFSPPHVRPRVLLIKSNTHRSSQQKVILNPQTSQSFEEMLEDISTMIKIDYPPVTALWTSHPPFRKVQSFSQMFRGLKNHGEFLACGTEGVPIEMMESESKRSRAPAPVPALLPKHSESLDFRRNVGYNRRRRRKSRPVKSEEFHRRPAWNPHPEASAKQNDLNFAPHNGKSIADSPETHAIPSEGYRGETYSPEVQVNYTRKVEQEAGQTPNMASQADDFYAQEDAHQEANALNGYQDSADVHASVTTSTQTNYQATERRINEHQNETSSVPSKHKPRSPSPSPPVEPELLTQKPYRRAIPLTEPVVKAHIHGRLREFYVPRYGQDEPDGERPRQRLKLDWVYGYRGRDARNNLHVLPSGELVYFAAGVAVVLDRPNMQQTHYVGHSEDISCMAVHPDRDRPVIATGQVAAKSSGNVSMVRVWNPYTMETIVVIGKNEFRGGVSSVGFSGESVDRDKGTYLLAVDEDEKHTLTVWDWRQARLIAKTNTTADTVVWAAFHPHDFTTIVSFGMQHIFFWKLFWEPQTEGTGRILRDKKSGIFEVDALPKFVTSLTFSPSGDAICGDSNGRISVWQRDNTDAYVINRGASHSLRSAHTKSVFALCMLPDGTLLSGGGNEIKAWDTQNGYKLVKERALSETSGFVRTLTPQHHDISDGSLYIGTTNNIILEGSLQEKFTTIVQGHHQPYPAVDTDVYGMSLVTAGRDSLVTKRLCDTREIKWHVDLEGHSEELWGAAIHDKDNSFVTAGYDQQVTLWNLVSHSAVWRTNAEKPCLSVAIDPSGRYIAVGTTVGRFIILRAMNGDHMASIQVGSESLDAIKFSPDGRLLAMGSHDHNIYVYEVLDEGHVYRRYKSGCLQGHYNFITHLDWSRDSRYLQSVSGDYDHVFWDVKDMRETWGSKMRDIEWATNTCILGYNSLGAWSNLREGEDLNTVCRSHDSNLLAVGDNHGAIRLYKYPCTAERPDYDIQKKCTGHISSVRFSQDDTYLVSTGGSDATILQWRVVDPASLNARDTRYE